MQQDHNISGLFQKFLITSGVKPINAKNVIMEDLHHLLNTRGGENNGALLYGIPNLLLFDYSSLSGKKIISKVLAQSIDHFEPRLDKLSIITDNNDSSFNHIIFYLTAKIIPQQVPLSCTITLDTLNNHLTIYEN